MTHLVFVPRPAGYELRELEGEPPARGAEVELEGRRFVVVKIGPAPLPAEKRPCAYLQAAS